MTIENRPPANNNNQLVVVIVVVVFDNEEEEVEEIEGGGDRGWDDVEDWIWRLDLCEADGDGEVET